ncbi:MAG: hypothetical protein HY690_15220 [Chloroflexi bacterium]|nr:hypothetical protein [Chloroflexota bacterium]
MYGRAKQLFALDEHVSILHGDSSDVLPEILSKIAEPALFWLDGHYSGGVTARGKYETPVWQELQHILNHSAAWHVILIDDARCFVGQSDYPTLQETRDLVWRKHPEWLFDVAHDIIRIHPGTTAL